MCSNGKAGKCMISSIVSTPKNPNFLSRLIGNCGCDTPENGGYTGRMNDKPLIFVLEERPTTIDPKTGERVYIDQLEPKDRFLGLFNIYI